MKKITILALSLFFLMGTLVFSSPILAEDEDTEELQEKVEEARKNIEEAQEKIEQAKKALDAIRKVKAAQEIKREEEEKQRRLKPSSN